MTPEIVHKPTDLYEISGLDISNLPQCFLISK